MATSSIASLLTFSRTIHKVNPAWSFLDDRSIVYMQLHSGHVVVIDQADYARVGGIKWHANLSRHTVYASTKHEGLHVNMQRFLLGFPSGPVDHIDGDGLNNRRSNLRICTVAENLRNSGPRNGKRFKGVHWKPTRRRFIAEISDGKGGSIHLGSFIRELDAAKAYNTAAKQLYGEFAWLNDISDYQQTR